MVSNSNNSRRRFILILMMLSVTDLIPNRLHLNDVIKVEHITDYRQISVVYNLSLVTDWQVQPIDRSGQSMGKKLR